MNNSIIYLKTISFTPTQIQTYTYRRPPQHGTQSNSKGRGLHFTLIPDLFAFCSRAYYTYLLLSKEEMAVCWSFSSRFGYRPATLKHTSVRLCGFFSGVALVIGLFRSSDHNGLWFFSMTTTAGIPVSQISSRRRSNRSRWQRSVFAINNTANLNILSFIDI